MNFPTGNNHPHRIIKYNIIVASVYTKTSDGVENKHIATNKNETCIRPVEQLHGFVMNLFPSYVQNYDS